MSEYGKACFCDVDGDPQEYEVLEDFRKILWKNNRTSPISPPSQLAGRLGKSQDPDLSGEGITPQVTKDSSGEFLRKGVA